MKHGALDCVEKPVDESQFNAKIKQVLSANTMAASIQEKLTRTERVVLARILQGQTSKAIALNLHRSPRTIEAHREHIMRKLRVSTISDLVLLSQNQRVLKIRGSELTLPTNTGKEGVSTIGGRNG